MTEENRMSYMSYLMLFCGLLLLRQSKLTLQELSALLPVRGNAEALTRALANASTKHEGCSFGNAAQRD